MAPLSPEQWHNRYRQQAGWTQQLRRHLFERLDLNHAMRLLEAGCGTGAVLAEVSAMSAAHSYGLDISFEYLLLARHHAPTARLAAGDAHCLPYASGSFDLVCCHYLLLWVKDPAQVVEELARITRQGGAVMLMAEPDYGGRIDYPQELESLAAWQVKSLHKQGADPLIGRRLAGLLAGAGLSQVEGGVLGGAWTGPPASQDWEMEWQVLRDDLGRLGQDGSTSLVEIDALQELDRQAWQRGERVLFVPTFYAWGRKE